MSLASQLLERGDIQGLDHLLQTVPGIAGAEPSLLERAAWDDNCAAAQLLLRHGAWPNAAWLKIKSYEMMEVLLNNGADPNHVFYSDPKAPDAKYRGRNTPLEKYSYDARYCKLLIERGARLTGAGNVLTFSIGTLNFEVVRVLLDHGMQNYVSPRDDSPIFAAMETDREPHRVEERLRMIELLLTYGVHIDSRNRFGETLLMASSQGSRSLPFLDLCIQHGADVNAQSNTGESALSMAVRGGNEEAVRRLLSAGAQQVNGYASKYRRESHADVAWSRSIRNCLLGCAILFAAAILIPIAYGVIVGVISAICR